MGGIDKIIKDGGVCAPDRETPDENEENYPRLGVIVGHTLKSPGAAFRGPGFKYEYDYNREVAYTMARYREDRELPMHLHVIFRDEIGIAGAYKVALEAHKCDMIIELHFNSFSDTSVRGTETLCTSAQDDRNFATIVQGKMCKVFDREGMSRGVKVIPRSGRGGVNIYSAPGVPNCLVEPFFGSSLEDAQLGFEKRREYARALVEAAYGYAKITGLAE